jgi:2-phosphoglycerate kinase
VKKSILIGGAPTVGKSYLAKKLAEDLKLPWISTDTVREVMRKVVTDKERFPHLLHTARYTAEQYFAEFNPEQIVKHQIEESYDTWQGVQALIQMDYVWDSFIIEGVGILPELVHRDFKDDPSVKPVFLVTENKERIREVVYTRGLWDNAKSYPDSVKDTEVEWAYLFSKWLHKEAEKYNFPVIDIDKHSDDYVEEIKKHL